MRRRTRNEGVGWRIRIVTVYPAAEVDATEVALASTENVCTADGLGAAAASRWRCSDGAEQAEQNQRAEAEAPDMSAFERGHRNRFGG